MFQLVATVFLRVKALVLDLPTQTPRCANHADRLSRNIKIGDMHETALLAIDF